MKSKISFLLIISSRIPNCFKRKIKENGTKWNR